MWNDNVNYETDNRIDKASLITLRKIVEKLNDAFKDDEPSEVIIPFEFIIGSLFPHSYENIKNVLTQQYIEGYNQGKKENENET